MMYLTFFLMSTFLVFGLFSLQSSKKKQVQKRIALITNIHSYGPEEKEEKGKSFNERIFQPLWKEWKKRFKRNMANDKEAKLELKLLQAGSPFGMTPVEYRIFQLGMFIVLPIIFGLYGSILKVEIGVIFSFVIVGLGVAAILPKFYLKQKTKVRSRKALRELPDVIDLLTVSLEAGLGFDSALSKIVAQKEGVLSTEFHRCLEEMRLGKTRREALSGVRDRLVVDEIRALISSILQAEKLGIGMVQVLRVQSVEVREQRKQRAEEEAMKAPIKMLFPLVIFIFPSLFIVLLGPAVIQMLNAFK